MNIYNLNKRQFDAVMKREGIFVKNYYDSDKAYQVFFRRNNRSNNPQGKLRLYYSQDTDIDTGTIFLLKGAPYLVVSRDADESDIYYTSLAVKCDVNFTVYSNSEERYVIVPFVVASDKYTISQNSTISMISGSVVMYTGLNDYVRDMTVNKEYNNFGGYYRVGNFFYNNNIAYVYLNREADKADTYSLTYNGATSLNLDDGTYLLNFTAIKNGNIVDRPSLVYAVSDNTVATVDENGMLTLLATGNVTITATWTDGNNTTCAVTIAIVNGGDIPAPIGGELTISGNKEMKVGFSRTYTAKYTDSSGNDVSDNMTSVWTISDCSFEGSIKRSGEEDNKIILTVDEEKLVGESFTLSVVDTEKTYTPASIQISIVEGW